MLIQLQATDLQLQEAVVLAGENPAHRIIQKVVANRKLNQPKYYDQYQCETYNKINFSFLPNQSEQVEWDKKTALKGKGGKFRQRQDTLGQIYGKFAEKRHLMVMETITEKHYIAPNNHHETVLMNQVSGIKNPSFVALAKDAQPFSFYDTHLKIIENSFLNPISKGSTNAYFFELKDSLYQAQDTVFIIAFQPKKGKTFEALKGLLYINTKQFAIQNVIASPADTSLTQIKIEQKYSYHPSAKKWFPEQLNFEWVMPKYPTPLVGLKIVGKSYLSKVKFKTDLHKKEFTAEKYVLDKNAHQHGDSTWQKSRYEELDKKEQETYIWWDTMPAAKKIGRIINASQALASGVYTMGKIDFDLQRLLRFNAYENTRIGLGLHTNKDWSQIIQIGGFIGYGTRDKAWKYGADIRLDINEKRDFFLFLNWLKDTRVPGIPQYPQFANNEYTLFDNGLYNFNMDGYDELGLRMGHTFFKNTNVQIGLSEQKWTINNGYYFSTGTKPFYESIDYTELSLGIRYAPNEQYIRFGNKKIPNPSQAPIFQFQWNKGIDLFNQDHANYNQFLFAIEHAFPIRRLGEMSYRIEAGWSSTDISLHKLFIPNGLGNGIQLFDFENTFQTMQVYEFLSDRFVYLFWEHNFGTISKKNKLIQPEIAIMQNIAYGTLKHPEYHYNTSFSTLEKGFFESGIALNNIVRVNYFNFAYIGLGWASYLRYGKNSSEIFEQNLAHRITINLDF